MEKLYEVLNEIDDSIDYQKETALIDEGVLDSLSVLSLVSELESTFDIEIGPVDLVPSNFNSAASMWVMIERLKSED